MRMLKLLAKIESIKYENKSYADYCTPITKIVDAITRLKTKFDPVSLEQMEYLTMKLEQLFENK